MVWLVVLREWWVGLRGGCCSMVGGDDVVGAQAGVGVAVSVL